VWSIAASLSRRTHRRAPVRLGLLERRRRDPWLLLRAFRRVTAPICTPLPSVCGSDCGGEPEQRVAVQMRAWEHTAFRTRLSRATLAPSGLELIPTYAHAFGSPARVVSSSTKRPRLSRCRLIRARLAKRRLPVQLTTITPLALRQSWCAIANDAVADDITMTVWRKARVGWTLRNLREARCKRAVIESPI
jgi:hypothetical protein